MKSYSIERARHIVLRAEAGDVLPGDITQALAEKGITCGWIRASGVLGEVELRALDAPEPRKIAGPVLALSIEGSVGLDPAEPPAGLRAILSRDTERGTEVLAGEIVSARVVALEAFVTAFEGAGLTSGAGDATIADEAPPLAGSPASPQAPQAPASAGAPSAASWTQAIAASAESDVVRQAASRGAVGGAIPLRPARVLRAYDEALVPEPGDIVDHFAFGRAEVIKSDGDRLHLRAAKDSRIREIALEMLKVTPIESEGPHRHFRLDRKM